MTQEQKDLLLKDLCARLPYGVRVHHLGNYKHNLYKLEAIAAINYEMSITSQGPYIDNCPFIAKCVGIEEIKPYLFPLSSMTIEQRYELHDLIHNLNVLAINGEIGDWIVSSSEIDWYNKNHFDYRGLIPKGLAIDATELNIY